MPLADPAWRDGSETLILSRDPAWRESGCGKIHWEGKSLVTLLSKRSGAWPCRLVKIGFQILGGDVRLRRLLCGRAVPFRKTASTPNPFSLGAQVEPARPARTSKNLDSRGKPEAFHTAGGQAAFGAASGAWRCAPASLSSSWLLVLTACLLMGVAGAAPTRAQRVSTPASDLPDQINSLASPLDGEPYYDAGGVPGQIQKLVLGSLTEWLSPGGGSHSPSPYKMDVRVRMQLENDFSKLHYPLFGRPAVFVKTWKGEEIIGAGYTLGWSDFDRVNCVALFERRAGKTALAAVTNFVPQADLHYAFLPPGPNGDFRFFVFGYLLGKSQPRLTTVFYAFNGRALKNLWEKQDVYDGKVQVTPDTVTLRYLEEDEYVQAVQRNHLPPGHETIYRVTPQGLTLETDHEIPYREVALQ